MDKPLSQERLNYAGIQVYYTNYPRPSIEKDIMTLIAEIKRLQAIEADYIALQEIMDRARKLAFLQAEEEDPRPRFKMDANGNLTRINYEGE